MKFHNIVINKETFSLPSCTGIIELARERGMLVGDQYLTYSDKILSTGSQAHKLAALILNGGHVRDIWDTLSPEIQNTLRALIRFIYATGFKARDTEFEVYSVALGIVGHPDTIGTIKQHIELIDWTTGAINTGKKIQLGFYYLAYKEMHPKRSIYGARAVHLDKQTGDWEQTIITECDLKGYARDFVAIREAIGVI